MERQCWTRKSYTLRNNLGKDLGSLRREDHVKLCLCRGNSASECDVNQKKKTNIDEECKRKSAGEKVRNEKSSAASFLFLLYVPFCYSFFFDIAFYLSTG